MLNMPVSDVFLIYFTELQVALRVIINNVIVLTIL